MDLLWPLPILAHAIHVERDDEEIPLQVLLVLARGHVSQCGRAQPRRLAAATRELIARRGYDLRSPTSKATTSSTASTPCSEPATRWRT